jgi:hypothetical protein
MSSRQPNMANMAQGNTQQRAARQVSHHLSAYDTHVHTK